jgi:membrane protein
MKDAFDLLKRAAWDWFDDSAPTLGAAVAYYTVFSLAPLFVIAVFIAGLVFGQEAAQGQIFEQLRALIGETSAAAMEDVVESANSEPTTGVFATIVGFIVLIVGASGVFAQMQASLNAIWRVEPKPGRGLWGLVQDRILSFGFILIVGFLLLISLILTAIIAFIGTWVGGFLPGVEVFIQILNAILSLAIIILLFAMIFKFLPDVKIAWRDVWIGPLITAGLFTAGKEILGLYLGKSGVASSYGAAGSLIVLLLWVYYSAQILFFGAEFTKAYANKFGSRVIPAENAIAVTKSRLS